MKTTINDKNRIWNQSFSSFGNFKLRMKRQLSDWVKLIDFIPNGQILIMAGTLLVTGVMFFTLISFYQNTRQTESDTFNMMQSVKDPFKISNELTEATNPIMQNVLTSGFTLVGLIASGAVLVCLDRTRKHLSE